MALGIIGQRADQLVSALPTTTTAYRGMNLIDDHHFRTGAFEIEKAALALDEIETDYRERISFEDACRIGKVPFEPGGRRSRDRRRRDGELGIQFVLSFKLSTTYAPSDF